MHLNIQYRMLPQICDLSNVISTRAVKTRIMPPDRDQRTRPGDAEHRVPVVYDGSLRQLTMDHLLNHIVWIDPYADPANLHMQQLNPVIRQLEQPWHE